MAEDNTQLLHDMAKLYYMDDMTQAKIAARFGLSRPTVSRLLAEAREKGIVKSSSPIPRTIPTPLRANSNAPLASRLSKWCLCPRAIPP